MNNKSLGLMILIVFALNTSLVLGQSLDDVFETLDDLNLHGSIENYPMIWDAIIFLTLFISIGRVVFEKQFSPAVGGVIGFTMAVFAMSGEIYFGFSIVQMLGPWFIMLCVGAVMYFLFKMFRGEKSGVGAFGIFVTLTVVLFGMDGPGEFINNTSPLLYTLLMIIMIVSFVYSLIRFFSSFGGGPDGAGGSGPGAFNRVADAIDGANNMRDRWRNFRGRPDQAQTADLTNNANNFISGVAAYNNTYLQLRSIISSSIGGPPVNLTHFLSTGGITVARYGEVANLLTNLNSEVTRLTSEATHVSGSGMLSHLPASLRTSFSTALTTFGTTNTNITTLLS